MSFEYQQQQLRGDVQQSFCIVLIRWAAVWGTVRTQVVFLKGSWPLQGLVFPCFRISGNISGEPAALFCMEPKYQVVCPNR